MSGREDSFCLEALDRCHCEARCRWLPGTYVLLMATFWPTDLVPLLTETLMDSQPATPIPPRCHPGGCWLTLAGGQICLPFLRVYKAEPVLGQAFHGGGGRRTENQQARGGSWHCPELPHPQTESLQGSLLFLLLLLLQYLTTPRAMSSQLSSFPSVLSPSLKSMEFVDLLMIPEA